MDTNGCIKKINDLNGIANQNIQEKYKSVIQYDLESNELKQWDTIQDAANYIGARVGEISVCCKGKTKTARGFKWKYK